MKMAANDFLHNVCLIFYILSIWSNTVVNTMNEWDTLEELPDLNEDDLKFLEVDIHNVDSGKLEEFIPDSDQSYDEGTINDKQAELLRKWDINGDFENLTLITRKFVNEPKRMAVELMKMILGKELLNMTTPLKKRCKIKYAVIPEHVRSFVLEYVNSHATSRINDAIYLETLKTLCQNLRKVEKRKSFKRDSILSRVEENSSPLQEEMLEKYHIDIDRTELKFITQKYHDDYWKMTRELLKLILGKTNLLHMYVHENSNPNFEPIPENVLNFVFQYANSFAGSKQKMDKFLKKVSHFCSQQRWRLKQKKNLIT